MASKDEKKELEYEMKLPFGLPPVLPDVEKQLKEYIICLERLPIHDYRESQLSWPRTPDPESLYHVELCPPSTTLKVERDVNTGEVLRHIEVRTGAGGLTARNSSSLSRAPLGPEEAVRGSASNFPFWPGGFPEPETTNVDSWDLNELLTTPPGFEHGFNFDALKSEEKEIVIPVAAKKEDEKAPEVSSGLIDLSAILRQEDDLLASWSEPVKSAPSAVKSKETKTVTSDNDISIELEKFLPSEEDTKIPILKISQPTGTLTSKSATEWAELIDVASPVIDFEQKVPDMAHKYPFELDPFQKQAIMHLERHEHVFVAAHTSAGKTVVAEYAIALSRKNLTRAIYTSPIKALSNQKYRDFHQTFGDVGLITGDFQLNQTASCLVMTTEILKSMLYCGSDVVRDLQYVIFDEVHYVNDPERGHVWEEVLILLPPHVVIVMLSATVPNTLQFADWVGRTKQRKVFVMSTPKRPVPLEHSLYMGFNQQVNNRQFVILDSEGNFRPHAIKEASLSIQKKEAPAAAAGRGGPRGRGEAGRGGRGDGRGGRGGRGGGGQGHVRSGPLSHSQQQTLWLSLLRDLEKREKLPTVAFTLSRKRCDMNAEMMLAVDLLTAVEKNHVHRFFQKCLQRLKEPDQKLPQVVRMQALLERGVGVHHSGILPILKEIVELLFQDGYVKFLFATETFAMGVNMPARTVVFDNIRKFDGTEQRYLQPAEYIQMAGRAGRRGLDPMGTVLILCASEPPPESELRSMMMGEPTKLTSQFRLTYAMMLTLLRVESITVEGMMKQSFREVLHKVKATEFQKQLKEVEEAMKDMEAPKGALVTQLKQFYVAANNWIEEWSGVADKILKQPGPNKELIPGRLLVVTKKGHLGKLGLVLKVESKSKGGFSVSVLVLCDPNAPKVDDGQPEKWYTMLGLANKGPVSIDSSTDHTVLTLEPVDLWLTVSAVTLKIDAEKVIGDWSKRQIPRFKNDPPWPACEHAVQELRRVSQSENLQFRPLIIGSTGECNVNDVNLRVATERMLRLYSTVASLQDVTNIANFEKEFQPVFQYEELARKKQNLNHLLSNASLSMFPQYQNRLRVLAEMKYVDRHNTVQLKGRVACEMGQNELLLTEMILAGILNPLDSAEIAALLSGLVFQQRRSPNNEPEDKFEERLSPALRQALEEMTSLAKDLVEIQRKNDVTQDEAQDYENSLNFELSEVIYHWARGKPFAEIMEMTEVQEGIIVRVIVQLGETLRDVKDAARIIGDPQLQTKMDEASNAIKRDIVFAASLYTQ